MGRLLTLGTAFVAAYLLAAYVLAPLFWREAIDLHPALAGAPHVTRTMNGIPGDPVNLALIGSEEEVVLAMTKAGWVPADPMTFESSVRIAVDSVFRRPDETAPVSSLYLFGRKQDLAFEQPIGDSPRRRHHVRFWRWDQQQDRRDVWFGSATLDERVGLSHTTGQVTHHISPDVDAERDKIGADLENAGQARKVAWKDGFHQELDGRNGGGDAWHTDGRLAVLGLVAAGDVRP